MNLGMDALGVVPCIGQRRDDDTDDDRDGEVLHHGDDRHQKDDETDDEYGDRAAQALEDAIRGLDDAMGQLRGLGVRIDGRQAIAAGQFAIFIALNIGAAV